MWLLLQKENGKEFIVNEKSIKKIEKISLGKKERVEEKERYFKEEFKGYNDFLWEDEFFGFNIYYDDGKKDTKVSILSVGDLNKFYEEDGYLGKIKTSTYISMKKGRNIGEY